MNGAGTHTIYTIGHSTRTWEDFVTILRTFEITKVVDIRRYPGSRKFPQFNQDVLRAALDKIGIGYVHLEALGGRRKGRPDSPNIVWRNASFRGYADYMETGAFRDAVHQLETIAVGRRTAYMCSEAVWWRCHRALVSDFLKARGWRVLHMLSATKSEEHPYTKPAQVIDGAVRYSAPST